MARFSSEEKIQAVRQYIDGNEGGQSIAKSIGVHPRNSGVFRKGRFLERIITYL
ncbi:hypothetical protein [Peribacillus simplex]|uniref:hypothetical protein n=1 Tax=Peribacillus simplex TaxID=1478 RepID=UPI00366AF6A6